MKCNNNNINWPTRTYRTPLTTLLCPKQCSFDSVLIRRINLTRMIKRPIRTAPDMVIAKHLLSSTIITEEKTIFEIA